MRRALCALALPLVLPAALAAQSVIVVSPQQCVWRAGDDPAWAAANLDESGWQPYANWKANPSQVRLWVRCRADLSSLQDLAHPAIQIGLSTPYELYLDGVKIGRVGDLGSGYTSVNSIRSFALPATQPPGTANVALRITNVNLALDSGVLSNLIHRSLEIRFGDAEMLESIRAEQVLTRAASRIEPAICFGIVGVLAIPLVGLFLSDRTRREFLLLGLASLSVAALRFNEFLVACLVSFPVTLSVLVWLAGNVTSTFTQAPFFYVLAGRRMPTGVKIILVAMALVYLPLGVLAVWGVGAPAWLPISYSTFFRVSQLLLHTVVAPLPFFVFWPYRSIAPRMRPLAMLCMAWGTVEVVWFLLQGTTIQFLHVPNLFERWGTVSLEARGILTAAVLAALMGLLFREQRQVTQERAMLAGEMQAASEIQRMLAPARLDAAGGLRIDVAFHPMRDVGGDFYQCRVLADGRQRVLMGDVSGKGTAAAMAATLLLGAAAARDSDSPAALLAHLNRVLGENRLGGFATCLCADVSADGEVTIANAGHLAPYCNGEELSISSGLPIGVNQPSADGYEERIFPLAPGDRLTFLSDGVVEARNHEGELFGFERAATLSTEPAEEIARAAQAFGQEDDITVLTLKFAGVAVAA